MAAPAREQVAAAAIAALEAIAGIAGLTVELRRSATISEDELPILVPTPGDVQETGDLTGERGWTLSLEVAGAAKGDTEAEAFAAAEALRAAAAGALLADVTLGGKARDVRLAGSPGAERLDLDAAVPTASFADTYEIDFATAEADLTVLL